MGGSCCKSTRAWKLNLQVVGDEGKLEELPYVVELTSHGCCCTSDTHMLQVNNRIKEERLYDNIWSPICFRGGFHEWEEKGHFFRIELPSIFIRDNLYVDGYEVKSRRDNARVWMYQLALFLILGMLLSICGFIFTIMEPKDTKWDGSRHFGISCLVFGFILLIPGIIGYVKAQNLSSMYKKATLQKRTENGEDITQL